MFNPEKREGEGNRKGERTKKEKKKKKQVEKKLVVKPFPLIAENKTRIFIILTREKKLIRNSLNLPTLQINSFSLSP